MVHVPVLAAEAIAWLGVRGDGVYVDCTTGAGGHSALIAERIKEFGKGRGRLVALDRDPAAVSLARERLGGFAQATVVHASYAELRSVLQGLGIARVDGVLIDAGVSSMQLDEAARGFSFQQEGPLDMRMDTTRGETAAEYLAGISEAELARVLREYADVRPAKRIARAICERRSAGAIQTTRDLAEAVSALFPYVQGTPDEVRQVFQAIRIAVNDELGQLRAGLEASLEVLGAEGRLVVISFHSGEDRVVKELFRKHGRAKEVLAPDGRVMEVIPARLRVLTRKPVTAGAEEVKANPRSKSAKLRAGEKV